jgi:hypothetical protein
MTPTRARPCVTREPTESDRVVVQMPSIPVRSQRPMMVNVLCSVPGGLAKISVRPAVIMSVMQMPP